MSSHNPSTRAQLRRFWRRLFRDFLADRTISESRREQALDLADAWCT